MYYIASMGQLLTYEYHGIDTEIYSYWIYDLAVITVVQNKRGDIIMVDIEIDNDIKY